MLRLMGGGVVEGRVVLIIATLTVAVAAVAEGIQVGVVALEVGRVHVTLRVAEVGQKLMDLAASTLMVV
jgi:hypothetical protein